MVSITPLVHRAVLTIAGDDRKSFLQGLVSNDVNKVSPVNAIWTALLTPQGKFLHEFFIAEKDETLFIEGEAERLEDLKTRLSRFKLRAKVKLEMATDLEVLAAWGEGAAQAFSLGDDLGSTLPVEGGIAFADPRHAEAGVRLLLPRENIAGLVGKPGLSSATQADWDAHRITLGLPDGSRDLALEKALLLEAGFEELHGVDFKKGCYMGQELTARTKYRGLVKKRLLTVQFDGPAPPPGSRLLTIEGKEAGEMGSATENLGLAMIRLERLQESPEFVYENTKIKPQPAAWVNIS